MFRQNDEAMNEDEESLLEDVVRREHPKASPRLDMEDSPKNKQPVHRLQGAGTTEAGADTTPAAAGGATPADGGATPDQGEDSSDTPLDDGSKDGASIKTTTVWSYVLVFVGILFYFDKLSLYP